MATDGFRLDPDDLAALAAGTADVAAQVRAAGDLARPIHVPSYGSVAAEFGEMALAAATRAGEAITDAAAAADRAAGTLRAELTGYMSVEQTAAAAFDGLAR